MEILFLVIILVFAAIVSFFLTRAVILKMKNEKMTGADMHKEGKPEIAEMGGMAVVGAFLLVVVLESLLYVNFGIAFSVEGMVAAILVIAITALIGTYDDIHDIRQSLKAALPLLASVPLVAIALMWGNNSISIPFLGMMDFGLLYPLLLIPLAVAVCSNLTNMLAGFNGLEAGMGIIIFAALSALAIMQGQAEMALICVAMLGALLGFIYFNWYPAKIFIGDVGTFTIGAAIAAAVIVSSFKSAGVILMAPFILDWFIKAYNKFPKSFAILKERKLYAPEGKIRGLADLVLKIFGGMHERALVLCLLGIELVIAIAVVLVFGKA